MPSVPLVGASEGAASRLARPALTFGAVVAVPTGEPVPAVFDTPLQRFEGSEFVAAGHRMAAEGVRDYALLQSDGSTCTGRGTGKAVVVVSPSDDLFAPPEPDSEESTLAQWFTSWTHERMVVDLVEASCHPFVAVPMGVPAPRLLQSKAPADGAAIEKALHHQSRGRTLVSAIEPEGTGLVLAVLRRASDATDFGGAYVLTRKRRGFAGEPRETSMVAPRWVTQEAAQGPRPGRVLVWGSAAYAAAMTADDPGVTIEMALHGTYE